VIRTIWSTQDTRPFADTLLGRKKREPAQEYTLLAYLRAAIPISSDDGLARVYGHAPMVYSMAAP
jgi:hypothetical protein